MYGLGTGELVIILLIVMLLFGVGKLGDVGGALGRSIREFKKSVSDEEPKDSSKTAEAKAEETSAG